MATDEHVEHAMAVYRKRQRRPDPSPSTWLIDVLMFRRMITPWLVRGVFLFALLAAFVVSSVVAYAKIAGRPPMMSFSSSGIAAPRSGIQIDWPTLIAIVMPFVWLAGVRVICECAIVLFEINSTLREMHQARSDAQP